jgi:alpha-tubulin suppressor-like RCC1 family protein
MARRLFPHKKGTMTMQSSVSTLAFSCLALAMVTQAADDLRIDRVTIANGTATVHLGSNSGSYYILRRGDTVSDIRSTAQLALGSVGMPLIHTNATNAAQFYRVEQVSMLAPRDSDGDGIDDVWELAHRHAGAALKPGDVEEDHDGNGVPDRMDYLRQTLSQGAVGSRPVISAGDAHSLALRTDGTLWGFGDNYRNQLGLFPVTETNVPVAIESGTNWVLVSASRYYSFALRGDGTLWAWGDALATATPKRQVGTNADWVYIAAGQNPLALKVNGSLWRLATSLTNGHMQVGGDTDWAALEHRSGGSGYAIKRNGTLWDVPTDSAPVQVGSDSDWRAVTATGATVPLPYRALAIKTNGTLWAFGSSAGGLLGLGSNAPSPSLPVQVGIDHDWAAVSMSDAHVLALKMDGSLWGWGSAVEGAIGGGTDVVLYTPTRIGTASNWLAVSAGTLNFSTLNHSIALDADGNLWTFGNNGFGQMGRGNAGFISRPQQVGSHTNWDLVTAGADHTLARKHDGTLWAWGRNFFGELGTGSNTNSGQPAPVQPGVVAGWAEVSGGRSFTVGIRSNGTLWAWGANGDGELGVGNAASANVPVQIGTGSNWWRGSAGTRYTLALQNDGSLWAWGMNEWGVLGTSTPGTNAPVRVGSENSWVRVYAGLRQSIGIQADGSLLAWGGSISGPYGSETLGGATPTRIGLGSHWSVASSCSSHGSASLHILALYNYAGQISLWSLGNNAFGQLGTTAGVTYPLNLCPVGDGTNWSGVAAGDVHSIALRMGTLWSWGGGDRGQTGFGARMNTFVPTQLGTDTNWTAIAVGMNHTIALKSDGTLWAWGDNSYGQCGQPASSGPAPVIGSGWGLPPR